jgi:hypothetical protein
VERERAPRAGGVCGILCESGSELLVAVCIDHGAHLL